MLKFARTLRREMTFLAGLRFLPVRVALFQWRAWRLAWREGDVFSQVSSTRPRKLAALLDVARGHRRVVELGTGTAWTSISLALADKQRVVLTCDPIERPERERYLQLVSTEAQLRLTFASTAGDRGSQDKKVVDLLYIDSAHDRESTIREVRAWWPVLKKGSVIVFDDFAHPEYPGVKEAVTHLGLEGEQHMGLFVYCNGDC